MKIKAQIFFYLGFFSYIYSILINNNNMTNFTNQDLAELFKLSVNTTNYSLTNKLREELKNRGFEMEFTEKERVKNQRHARYEYLLKEIVVKC